MQRQRPVTSQDHPGTTLPYPVHGQIARVNIANRGPAPPPLCPTPPSPPQRSPSSGASSRQPSTARPAPNITHRKPKPAHTKTRARSSPSGSRQQRDRHHKRTAVLWRQSNAPQGRKRRPRTQKTGPQPKQRRHSPARPHSVTALRQQSSAPKRRSNSLLNARSSSRRRSKPLKTPKTTRTTRLPKPRSRDSAGSPPLNAAPRSASPTWRRTATWPKLLHLRTSSMLRS